MAKWTESKQNKDIIAQLTATREDINVLAEKKLNEIKQQAQDLAINLNQEIKKDVTDKMLEANEAVYAKIEKAREELHNLIADAAYTAANDFKINEKRIAQTNVSLDASKSAIHDMLAELSKSLDVKYGIVNNKLDEAIRQQAKEIQDLRESMLELMENAECKAKAENKAIEQYNDCMFKWQAKLIKRLNIAMICCAIAIVGVIIYEIIK